MNVTNDPRQEFATLIEETGQRIAEDYYFAFCEFLAGLNIPHLHSVQFAAAPYPYR